MKGKTEIVISFNNIDHVVLYEEEKVSILVTKSGHKYTISYKSYVDYIDLLLYYNNCSLSGTYNSNESIEYFKFEVKNEEEYKLEEKTND